MAHIVADRVQETSTTTGTGNLTLAGAATGYRAFSAVAANNDTFFYCVEGGSEWEVGLGTYVSATPALARTTIIASSNAGSAVNFSAGTKNVFLTSPAQMQSWGVVTASPSANQDNYNPTGMAFANVLRLTPTASITISGFGGGVDGRQLKVVNASTDYLIILPLLSTASSAGNRFVTPSGGLGFLPLCPGDSVDLWYDGVSAGWRLDRPADLNPAEIFDTFTDWSSPPNNAFTSAQNGTGAGVAGSTFGAGATEKLNGAVRCQTGSTATGRASFNSNGLNTGGGFTPAQGGYLFATRLCPEALSTGTQRFQVWAGNHDGGQGTNVTDGVYWEYDDVVSTDWRFCVAGTSTRTKATVTGFTVSASTYCILGFWVNPAWSRVDPFYSTDGITFTFAASASGTDIPTSTELTDGLAIGINKTVGTTASAVSVDWCGHRSLVNRG